MALVRSILFVDGENLTFRYQKLLADGRIAKTSVVHIQDTLVWVPEIAWANVVNTDLIRINYYTSMAGDDDAISGIKNKISSIYYRGHGDYYGYLQLNPRVYKKVRQSNKSRLVDINITIDIMRHCYRNDIDVVYLFSGDGDFLHLVEEIARSGKKVCVGAFSSGLDPRMPSAVDRFCLLDDIFFDPVPPQLTVEPTAVDQTLRTNPSS